MPIYRCSFVISRLHAFALRADDRRISVAAKSLGAVFTAGYLVSAVGLQVAGTVSDSRGPTLAIRVGVIGAGRIVTGLHLPSLNSHPRAEVAALRAELAAMAESLHVENAAGMRKQDLIFAILKATHKLRDGLFLVAGCSKRYEIITGAGTNRARIRLALRLRHV